MGDRNIEAIEADGNEVLVDPVSEKKEPTQPGNTGEKDGFYITKRNLAIATGVSVAGVAAIVTLLAGGIEDRESQPAESTHEQPTDESQPPSIDERPPAPAEDFFSSSSDEDIDDQKPQSTENSEASDVETVNDVADFEPRLLQGDTPREVLEAFEHNFNCIHNAPIVEQQECIRYTAGDGSINVRSNLAEIAAWAREYRAEYLPDTGFDLTVSVHSGEITTPLDEPVSGDGFRVIADVRDSVTGNGYLRDFVFAKEALTITETDVTVSDPTVTREEIYVLNATRSIDPGTDVRIGQ